MCGLDRTVCSDKSHYKNAHGNGLGARGPRGRARASLPPGSNCPILSIAQRPPPPLLPATLAEADHEVGSRGRSD